METIQAAVVLCVCSLLVGETLQGAVSDYTHNATLLVEGPYEHEVDFLEGSEQRQDFIEEFEQGLFARDPDQLITAFRVDSFVFTEAITGFRCDFEMAVDADTDFAALQALISSYVEQTINNAIRPWKLLGVTDSGYTLRSFTVYPRDDASMEVYSYKVILQHDADDQVFRNQLSDIITSITDGVRSALTVDVSLEVQVYQVMFSQSYSHYMLRFLISPGQDVTRNEIKEGLLQYTVQTYIYSGVEITYLPMYAEVLYNRDSDVRSQYGTLALVYNQAPGLELTDDQLQHKVKLLLMDFYQQMYDHQIHNVTDFTITYGGTVDDGFSVPIYTLSFTLSWSGTVVLDLSSIVSAVAMDNATMPGLPHYEFYYMSTEALSSDVVYSTLFSLGNPDRFAFLNLEFVSLRYEIYSHFQQFVAQWPHANLQYPVFFYRTFPAHDEIYMTLNVEVPADQGTTAELVQQVMQAAVQQTSIAAYVSIVSVEVYDYQHGVVPFLTYNDTQTDCLLSISGCIVCDGAVCSVCDDTTVINSNGTACQDCEVAIPGCVSCSGGSCTTCSDETVRNDDGSACEDCEVAIPHCVACSGGSCTTCSDITVRNDNGSACEECSVAIPGCVTCAAGLCVQCSDETVLSEDMLVCIECGEAIPDCVACSGGICTTCNNETQINEDGSVCEVHCPPGHELLESGCRECPLGTYNNGSSEFCVPCPDGTTTADTGATHQSDCTTEMTTMGHDFETSANTVEKNTTEHSETETVEPTTQPENMITSEQTTQFKQPVYTEQTGPHEETTLPEQTTMNVIDPCMSVVCENRGRCEVVGDAGRCDCRPAYAGDRCQRDASVDSVLRSAIQITLDNDFSAELQDKSSEAYSNLTAVLSNWIEQVLLDRYFNTFLSTESFIYSSGSIVATVDVVQTDTDDATPVAGVVAALEEGIPTDVGPYRITGAAVLQDPCTDAGRCGAGTCTVHSAGRSYQCTCPVYYTGDTCQDAVTVIASFQPSYGPQAGGTKVKVRGHHLKITDVPHLYLSNENDELYHILCDEMSGSDSELTCRTMNLTNTALLSIAHPLVLSWTEDNSTVALDGFTYTYRGNPAVQSIHPLETIIGGGITLTVTGENMDSVAAPELLTTVNIPSHNYTNTNETICTSSSTTELLCPTPPIHIPEGVSIEETECTDTIPGTAKHCTEDIEVTLGLRFDGYNKYEQLDEVLPEFSELRVVLNPSVSPKEKTVKYKTWWPHDPGKVLLEGSKLDTGDLESSFQILINDEACSEIEITDTTIAFLPHGHVDAKKYDIQVKFGSELSFHGGQIEFELSIWDCIPCRYGLCFGAAIVVVLLFIILYWKRHAISMCLKNYMKDREEKKKEQRWSAMQDAEYNVQKQNSYIEDESKGVQIFDSTYLTHAEKYTPSWPYSSHEKIHHQI